MQIHRLHLPEAAPNPLHTKTSGGASDVSDLRPATAEGDVSSTAPDSALATYVAQLRQIPDTRDSVVARAREKVAGGDYLTRTSAEATAEVVLRSV